MPYASYDVLKTIAGKYQVVRVNDNTTMGPTFFTRAEAEQHMQSLYDADYGMEHMPQMMPIDDDTGSTQEQAERKRNKPSKGVIPGTPGTDTKGDKKAVK